jgi:hypothetical protein
MVNDKKIGETVEIGEAGEMGFIPLWRGQGEEGTVRHCEGATRSNLLFSGLTSPQAAHKKSN